MCPYINKGALHLYLHPDMILLWLHITPKIFYSTDISTCPIQFIFPHNNYYYKLPNRKSIYTQHSIVTGIVRLLSKIKYYAWTFKILYVYCSEEPNYATPSQSMYKIYKLHDLTLDL